MAKKALKGKRMKISLTDGFDEVELKGTQAFGYRSNVKKEGHGEYGSDGDVITIVSFENVTGSLDVQDQNDQELKEARALMTGKRKTDTTGIDFANPANLWLWKNNYDPDDASKTKIISSDLIKEVRFDEDYKSELENIHTRAFDFQALRAINFPEHAISFQSWAGDETFNFTNSSVAYVNEDALSNNVASGYVLALFVDGVWSTDKIDAATSSSVSLSSSVTLNSSVSVTALTLYDAAN